MTPAQLRTLATLAIQVSCEAPVRFSNHGNDCYISRKTVREIRELCEQAGIDWKKAAKETRDLAKKGHA